MWPAPTGAIGGRDYTIGPQNPRHRAGGARSQPGDRGRQGRGRPACRVPRAAVGGGPLGGRQHERGVPAGRAAAQPSPGRPAPPLRLRQGALLLVAARGRGHLRHGRLLLVLPGSRGAQERRRREAERYVAGLIVLGVALLAEGGSLLRALYQVRRQGGRLSEMRDPALRTVVAEDGTAVLGVTLAIVGMALHMITGQVVWEASASLAIGALLVYVAYRLGREARDQLIGEAADPEASDRIRELLRTQPEIDSVEALLTMKTGLDTALVAARVDLVPGIESERLEEVAVRIKRSIARQVPEADQIFLDVTERGSPEAREAWESPAATGERGGA
ncbi:integral membrane protein [Streptomyces griseoflavus Tu4000]|uniref:Integral membrane protein n=1 Tax=Streptomyces griseoflavus Tu4000 TaxID=467200 RepID=D9Y236_9ACTN|nr:integral membrane protein [Streptomyces griseoflavus Tu4000]